MPESYRGELRLEANNGPLGRIPLTDAFNFQRGTVAIVPLQENDIKDLGSFKEGEMEPSQVVWPV